MDGRLLFHFIMSKIAICKQIYFILSKIVTFWEQNQLPAQEHVY